MSTQLEVAIKALRAHKAWQIAEECSMAEVDFDARTELCRYAQHLTDVALGMSNASYEGVPHMIVWPTVEIKRAAENDAQALVETILARKNEGSAAA